MAAMMHKRAAFATSSRSAVSPSTRSAVVARAQALSASDLAAFKIVDLVEIAGKRGVSGGRNATRDSLTNAILRAGVTVADLTKGQLAELKAKNPSIGSGSSYSSSSYSATSSGDRFANFTISRGNGSSPAASGSAGGAKLSAGDLSAFKIVDLVEIAGKKGVRGGRNATRESLTSALVSAGVTLADLSRGQLVDLGIKLGKAGLSRDINAARAELASLIGGGGSAPASWRSTPTPTASTDRFANFTVQRSSSPAAGGAGAGGSSAKLGAGDLAHLRIDDLRDLVKKTGAQLPREPTKDGVISALIGKGVSLADLTRGMLVDLANKLGSPLARDVDSLRKNLANAVGKGSYSRADSAASSSSWRTPEPAAPATSSGDRWANYSRSNSSNGRGAAAGGSQAVYEADLAGFKIDVLSELARKKGISMRNATKDSLISSLAKTLTLADLSRGQLVEILHKIGQPTSGSVEDMRSRVAAAASQRQSARSLAGSRW